MTLGTLGMSLIPYTLLVPSLVPDSPTAPIAESFQLTMEVKHGMAGLCIAMVAQGTEEDPPISISTGYMVYPIHV